MRLFRSAACSIAGFLFLVVMGPARADAPPDALRLMPDQADLVVKIERPRQLVESVVGLDLLKQLRQFDAFREFMDSTNYRRFYRFVAYLEKKLGAQWPELLDRLTGGGVALGIKFAPDPAPALLIVQGSDEVLLQKAVKLALEMIEQELARQESKERIEKGNHRGRETIRIGKDFHAAVAGTALLIANKPEVLHAGLDMHLDRGKKSVLDLPSVGEARKLLPAQPLVWLWANLEPVHKAPQAREVFALPRNDANLTVLFGNFLDLAGRASFVAAGLHAEKEGALLTIRMPAGRDGMTPALALHVPPEGQPGSLPLLEPRGVLYSASYYFDLSKFWDDRARLFNDKQIKGLEEFDKNSGKFLAGSRFSQLLQQAGPRQRLVVAHQATSGYKVAPGTRLPAFALVVDMRQPERFGKSMEAILRGAAFLAGTQVNLKLVEEKHGETDLIGYRFPEDGKFPNDPAKIRFNFSPCFATVGDQWFVASTIELGRELIDLLNQEAKRGRKGSPLASRDRFYSAGGADWLASIEDTLLAQTILDQALPPKEARQQVKAFVEFVRKLGVLQTEIDYGAREFRYDIRFTQGK